MVKVSQINDLASLVNRKVRVTKTYSTNCYAGATGTITGAEMDGERATVTTVIDNRNGRTARVNWLRRPPLDELENLELIDEPFTHVCAETSHLIDATVLLTLL